jgi:hypothetical protein
VDRHCINQLDYDEKEQQIRQMHHIYQQAFITIIAAAGESAEAGLAGIHETPRKQQPSVEIDDLSIINTPVRHPKHTIPKSTWTTRAWTFQEAILFRRRLVFTAEHMYFECEEMHC